MKQEDIDKLFEQEGYPAKSQAAAPPAPTDVVGPSGDPYEGAARVATGIIPEVARGAADVIAPTIGVGQEIAHQALPDYVPRPTPGGLTYPETWDRTLGTGGVEPGESAWRTGLRGAERGVGAAIPFAAAEAGIGAATGGAGLAAIPPTLAWGGVSGAANALTERYAPEWAPYVALGVPSLRGVASGVAHAAGAARTAIPELIHALGPVAGLTAAHMMGMGEAGILAMAGGAATVANIATTALRGIGRAGIGDLWRYGAGVVSGWSGQRAGSPMEITAPPSFAPQPAMGASPTVPNPLVTGLPPIR